MQLKLTETMSGLSDKDIKTMTKLVYTVSRDVKDLADICQVTAAVHELIFGAGSPLTEMLVTWFLYLTGGNGNAGNTVGHLQGMASADPTMACRLAWFIEKRRQQFLLSCLTANDNEWIDYRALDFHGVGQSIKDDNFHFKACAFLLDRLPGGGGRRTRNTLPTPTKTTTPGKIAAGGKRGAEPPSGGLQQEPERQVADIHRPREIGADHEHVVPPLAPQRGLR